VQRCKAIKRTCPELGSFCRLGMQWESEVVIDWSLMTIRVNAVIDIFIVSRAPHAALS
jgi:hypothetical protein